MKDRQEYKMGRPVSAHDKFEALRDFVEGEFAQGVSAADALLAVRKKAAELGMTRGLAPRAVTKPRFRLVAER